MRSLIIIVVVGVLISLQYGCKENSTEPCDDNQTNDSSVVVYKPNLYLYPTKETNLSIKIIFPLGGNLLESIPNYNGKWNVIVEPNGLINKIYRFLFYEYRVPDRHQMKYGWLIPKKNLKSFFENNMKLFGFNEFEIKDFTDYWIPVLDGHDYYEIYPQYKNILDQMSVIELSIKPDNFYRLQYLIRGRSNNNISLLIPIVEYAKREGFHVMEWGVMLK